MNKSINKIIKKYIKLSVLSIIAVVLVMTGVTYALFQTEHKNTTNQAISIGDLDASLTSSSGLIKLYDLYPQSSSEIIGTNNNKYTFTLSNTGDYNLAYSLYLTDETVSYVTQNPTDSGAGKDLTSYTNFQTLQTNSGINGYDYINFSLDGGAAQKLSSIYDSVTGRFNLKSGTINSGAQEDHYIQFWLDNGDTTAGPPNAMQNTILVVAINMTGSASGPNPIHCLDGSGNTISCPSTFSVGDRIAIGDEVFRFIRYTSTSSNLNECGGETGTSTPCGDATNGDIRALAEYNLYVGHIYDSNWNKTGDITNSDAKYGKQDSTARGYVEGADSWIGTTEFSSSSVKGTNYSSYTGSIVEEYVEEYVQYLSDEYDATVSGGLITKYEIMSLCNLTGSGRCANTNPWVYTTSYWSGSPDDSYIVWSVDSDGSFIGYDYSYDDRYGVRPVITISASDI